jgi:signal transduction histidine kinase
MTAPRSERGLRQLTVQSWVQVVLAAMAVLVFGCAAVGASLLSQSAEVSDQLVDRISPARTAIGRLQSAVLDQETGFRGYLLTGDRQFLEPYNDGVAAENAEAERITTLVGDRPVLAADLATVRRAVAGWRRTYAEPVIRDGRADAASQQRQVEASRLAFDRIRAEFAVQNAHIDDVRIEARAELDRTQTQRDWAFLGMLVAFALTGVALAVLLRRTVGQPLRQLREASREVASGDFAHQLPAHGPADIREVARDMEAMRQRIVDALEASRQQETVLTSQAADLDAQAEELRRSNAELEQFAYVASHDLQEPLRKVASFCQLIEKRYGDKLDARGIQYIDFAVDGARRMQVLINDLLAFSRVGRLNDAREPVALDRSLDRAVANLAASVEDTGARVERPDALPEVIGDPTLLGMLWQTLLGNAIKFRDPDRPPVVTVECGPDEESGEWRFSVTDNGIGIPPEFADKVFVIFQRLHARDAYGGTGIGLAMCKKIVEHHGGRIWIDTDHTGGTRIWFTLPASPLDTPDSGDVAADTATALEGTPA